MNLKRVAKIVALLFVGSQIPGFIRGFHAGANNTDGYNNMTWDEKLEYLRTKA